MYIVGLGVVFSFLVPGTCEVQSWFNIKYIPQKVCKNTTNELQQFLQENSGGNQYH
jgi:hypothetical protein